MTSEYLKNLFKRNIILFIFEVKSKTEASSPFIDNYCYSYLVKSKLRRFHGIQES